MIVCSYRFKIENSLRPRQIFSTTDKRSWDEICGYSSVLGTPLLPGSTNELKKIELNWTELNSGSDSGPSLNKRSTRPYTRQNQLKDILGRSSEQSKALFGEWAVNAPIFLAVSSVCQWTNRFLVACTRLYTLLCRDWCCRVYGLVIKR